MIYTLYIIIALLIAAYYIIITQLQLNSMRRNVRLCNLYTNQIADALLHEDRHTGSIIASSKSERRALTETLFVTMSHCYDINCESISTIIKNNNIENFIMQEMRFASKTQRALLWLQLATITPSARYKQHLRQELRHDDHHLRSCALVALLNVAPEESIKTLTNLNYHLQSYDISRIISLVRRGRLPLAIDPLLQSESYNLKRLALAIIRVFNLEISIKNIYSFIEKEENLELINEAIYTLATLKHPLSSSSLRAKLLTMSKIQRKNLCRFLSSEGYSLHAMQWLFPQNEIEYAKQLITSYKRMLVHPNLSL